MKNTFDRTVHSLCCEIDELREEVSYWKNKYEEERRINQEVMTERLTEAKRDVANTLRLALSMRDDADGNLVIDRENRQSLAATWEG